MPELSMDLNLAVARKLDPSPFNDHLDDGDAARFSLFGDDGSPSLRIRLVMYKEGECLVSSGYIDGAEDIQCLINHLQGALNAVKVS